MSGSNIFDSSLHKQDLLFLPIGGCEQIGLNFNLYHLDGHWIIADCGAGFAGDDMPGVDMLVPDLSGMEKAGIKPCAVVLTHAHEDHVGALWYLWQKLECPIYATEFTTNFLKEKLADFPSIKRDKISWHILQDNVEVKIKSFTIRPIGLTHSIPEMKALAIETRYGIVVHTGDWKFDAKPLIGGTSDYEALKEIGDSGKVLAVVSDSTNIMSSGWSSSEGDLRENLIKVVERQHEAVIITTFASNVARVETVAFIAKSLKKRLVVAGFSLWRIIRAAQKSGYLRDYEFIDAKDASGIDRKSLIILCTGCQGEEKAAISKACHNVHPFLKIRKSDTVIFASKIIPGNDRKIGNLINSLILKGVKVITERDEFVHASGHPKREEVKAMYEMLKPKAVIPVHGEPVHTATQAAFAKECGIAMSGTVKNGEILKIAESKIERVGVVDSGYLGIDGKKLRSKTSTVISGRKILRREGVVFCTAVFNAKGSLVANPQIYSHGCIDGKDDAELIKEIEKELRDELTIQVGNAMKKAKQASGSGSGSKQTTLKQTIINIVSKKIQKELGKSPIIDAVVTLI